MGLREGRDHAELCWAMLLREARRTPAHPLPSGKGAALLRWEATVLSDFSSPQG